MLDPHPALMSGAARLARQADPAAAVLNSLRSG